MRALLTSSLLFAAPPRRATRCQIPISMAATDPRRPTCPNFSGGRSHKMARGGGANLAVVVRRDVIAPYIVVGSIGSAFCAKS